ncbi:acyltransferase family protein [Arabiibacter massiliensis]|uniref:acyltransferase family protein n=1 Tax=Arabiibacter massiliensis TaxID=1870985 RepID=UPI00155B2B98|nr:acyltransferase [Arabiibacter massiliensis]
MVDKRMPRQSGLELLRILSMLAIVLSHFSVHGPWTATTDPSMRFVLDAMQLGSRAGVACFIMLTGYFQVSSSFKIRSLLRLLLEVWLYSFTILAVVLLLDYHAVDSSDIIGSVFPILTASSWFVLVYVIIYALSPFLNKLARALSRDAYRVFLGVAFFFLSISKTLFDTPWISYPVTWLLYCYFLAAYFRLHPLSLTTKSIAGVLVLSVLALFAPVILSGLLPSWLFESRGWGLQVVCLLAGLFAAGYAGLRFFKHAINMRIALVVFVVLCVLSLCMAGFRNGTLQGQGTYFMEMWMLPDAVFSAAAFLLFSRLNLGCHPAINAVARTVFGVYLIHDNPLVRERLWEALSFVQPQSAARLLLVGIGVAVCVFVMCSLVDAARARFLEKPFMTTLDKGGVSRMLDGVDKVMNQ